MPGQPDFYRHPFTSLNTFAYGLYLEWYPRHAHGHTTLAHLFHHLLHLAKLLDELLDILLRGARAAGDSACPAWVLQQPRIASLLAGHRGDHSFDPTQDSVIYVHVLKLLIQSRYHPEETRQRPHLLDHLHLPQEVLEVELPGEHLLALGFGLPLVHLALGLLDEGEDVPHPQDAPRHPVGVEVVELPHLLALAGELYGAPRNGDHRQCRPSARVAV